MAHPKRPYLVGIAGPSCSGKTWLARKVSSLLPSVIVSLDSYYRDLSHLPLEERASQNFDDPEALDWELLVAQMSQLAAGESIRKPVYNFATHTREQSVEVVEPAAFVIVEGLFALHHEALRALMGTSVFVWLEDETCLSRRLERDARERGRTAESIVRQYSSTVRPMADRYVLPTRRFAHLALHGCDPVDEMAARVLARIHGTPEEERTGPGIA